MDNLESCNTKAKCSTCKEEKDIQDLRVKSSHKGKYQYYQCAACKSKIDKAYREKNKEKLSARNKEKWHKDIDLSRRKHRESYSRNAESNREKDRARHTGERAEKNRIRLRERYHANKEAHKKACQEYRQKNKENRNKQENARWKEDSDYNLVKTVRNTTNRALRGTAKLDSTIKMLGCTHLELRNHLENKFSNGMSWENKGEWHIDHIIPCASFDLSDPEQQKSCFHYTNLQPLWAKDNLSKHAKILTPVQMSLPI